MKNLLKATALTAIICLAGAKTANASQPTYHINFVYLTLQSVKLTTTLTYATAGNGKVYFVATFKEINHDDVQQEISYNDIKLITQGGQTIDQSFDSPDNSLTSLVLDPGGTGTGAIAWQIPKGMHKATLRWAPQPLAIDVHWPAYNWHITY